MLDLALSEQFIIPNLRWCVAAARRRSSFKSVTAVGYVRIARGSERFKTFSIARALPIPFLGHSLEGRCSTGQLETTRHHESEGAR